MPPSNADQIMCGAHVCSCGETNKPNRSIGDVFDEQQENIKNLQAYCKNLKQMLVDLRDDFERKKKRRELVKK